MSGEDFLLSELILYFSVLLLRLVVSLSSLLASGIEMNRDISTGANVTYSRAISTISCFVVKSGNWAYEFEPSS